MKRPLAHLFFIALAFLWLSNIFFFSIVYYRRKGEKALEIPGHFTLSNRERKRFKHYFYGTTFLSGIFCALRGQFRNARERWLFVNSSALGFSFDDLSDRIESQGFNFQNIRQYGQGTPGRELAQHFFDNVKSNLPPNDFDEFQHYVKRVFEVETGGRQRGNRPLPLSELKKITAEKGGYSVLMFRRLLEAPINPQEQKAWLEFGHLIQLCDDIFDIWFDFRDGIHTAAVVLVSAQKIGELAEYFENQVRICRQIFFESGFSKWKTRVAWASVYFLVGITRVCLKHYQELSNTHGEIPVEDRNLMVVDMEKWKNRIAAAREVLRS